MPSSDLFTDDGVAMDNFYRLHFSGFSSKVSGNGKILKYAYNAVHQTERI